MGTFEGNSLWNRPLLEPGQYIADLQGRFECHDIQTQIRYSAAERLGDGQQNRMPAEFAKRRRFGLEVLGSPEPDHFHQDDTAVDMPKYEIGDEHLLPNVQN